MPVYAKKNGKDGKLVIINLQPTKHDKKADLIIRTYADQVFQLLFNKLDLQIPEYQDDNDPVKQVKKLLGAEQPVEWTQSNSLAKKWGKKCKVLESELKELRKLQKLNKKCSKQSDQNGLGGDNKGNIKTENIKDEDIKTENGVKQEETNGDDVKEIKDEIFDEPPPVKLPKIAVL